MMGRIYSGKTNWRPVLRDDFMASLIVFLVALPLCLGIAIACGLPPGKGLITGIIGGLVVGSLAGCPLQVSGPAAGLIVIVADIFLRFGLAGLGVIIFLGGVMQVVAGLLRMGQWFRAVSPAVIQGMLTGIGILILASQFHLMVDDEPRSSGIANIVSLPESVLKGLNFADPSHAGPNADPALAAAGAASVEEAESASHHWAALIGVITIAIIVFWRPLVPGRLKLIPAPIVAIVAACVVVATMGLPVRAVNVPTNFLGELSFMGLADLHLFLSGEIWIAALGLAIIASAETLLCATAVDQMQNGPRTRYDRELFSQGVGNMLCGFLQALPMTGVIVRSSANVEAGAKTRASAIFHGAWLLFFAALVPWLLNYIPQASLAAVLVYTGWKLINPKAIRRLWNYGREEAMICLATTSVIVFKDLLVGVLTGIVLAAARLLYKFSQLDVRVDRSSPERTVLHLNGTATFLRLPKLAAVLDAVPANTELHVHFENLDYIDHACLDLLMNWEASHKATGGKLVIDWNSLTAIFQGPEEPEDEAFVEKQEMLNRQRKEPAGAH